MTATGLSAAEAEGVRLAVAMVTAAMDGAPEIGLRLLDEAAADVVKHASSVLLAVLVKSMFLIERDRPGFAQGLLRTLGATVAAESGERLG